MNKYLIRQATENDVVNLALLDKECFDDPWSEKMFQDEMKNDIALYMVVESVKGEILSYGGLWLINDEGHITNIGVRKEHRGKRLGEKVIISLLEEARKKGIKKFTLEVRVSNKKAISLYRKLGFIGVGVRPKYYLDNLEDAYIMWKKND